MREVVRLLGLEFAKLIYLDRNWLWYCGESLQHNVKARTVLKTLGFRFAPAGHPMKIGDTVITSHWGHSCEHPIRRFKKKSDEPRTTETSEVDAGAALAEL